MSKAIRAWKGAVEPAETGWTQDELVKNLVSDSESVTTGWVANGSGSVNANSETDPDGGTTAHQIVDTAGGGTGTVGWRTNAQDFAANATLLCSVWVAADGLDWAFIGTQNFAASANDTFYVNLLTGAQGSGGGDFGNITISDEGGGWYLVSFTVNTTADGNGRLLVAVAEADGDNVVDLDGTSSIKMWRPMVENVTGTSKVAPTSYTPTTGAAAVEQRHRTEGAVSKTTVENLVTDSSDLTAASWTKNRCTAGVSVLTADAVTNSVFAVDTVATGVAVDDEYSFTLKALPGTYDYLWIGDRGNLPVKSATIDLSDGSIIGSESGVTVATKMGRDGRWLIKFDYTRTWAGSVTLNIGFGGASHSTDIPSATYAGTETLNIWDIQSELGATVRTANDFFVRTSGAVDTKVFGGNVIYLYKGAVQPAEASGISFIGGLVRNLVRNLVRPLVR